MSDFIDGILNAPETKEINEIVAAVMESDPGFSPSDEVAKHLPYADHSKRVRVNDLVPEEYQMRLMQIDFTLSNCYWMIGDIANELVGSANRQRAQELGRAVTNQDIHAAVGYFCHRTARTVRYYWETARTFPPEMRQEYDAPFATWVVAKWVDDPRLFLQIATDNPQLSTAAVRMEYYKQKNTTPPTRDTGIPDVDDSGAETPPDVGGESDISQGFKGKILARLDSVIDGLRVAVERLNLPVEIKTRIGDVLLELQDIALEIRRIG